MTDRRLQQAEPVLEKYRVQFVRAGRFDAGELENEIKTLFDVGYQEAKDLLSDLAKQPRYLLIAAYYMQHIYPQGPAAEFKPVLANIYGAKSYHHADGPEKQESFWQRFSDADARERGADSDD